MTARPMKWPYLGVALVAAVFSACAHAPFESEAFALPPESVEASQEPAIAFQAQPAPVQKPVNDDWAAVAVGWKAARHAVRQANRDEATETERLAALAELEVVVARAPEGAARQVLGRELCLTAAGFGDRRILKKHDCEAKLVDLLADNEQGGGQ